MNTDDIATTLDTVSDAFDHGAEPDADKADDLLDDNEFLDVDLSQLDSYLAELLHSDDREGDDDPEFDDPTEIALLQELGLDLELIDDLELDEPPTSSRGPVERPMAGFEMLEPDPDIEDEHDPADDGVAA